jgi:hypothetical protein
MVFLSFFTRAAVCHRGCLLRGTHKRVVVSSGHFDLASRGAGFRVTGGSNYFGFRRRLITSISLPRRHCDESGRVLLTQPTQEEGMIANLAQDRILTTIRFRRHCPTGFCISAN